MSDDASMSCVSCTTFFANEQLESDLYHRLYEKATTMKKPDCQLPEHIKHNDLIRQMVASTIGTVVSVITLNPISVMKIMIQREDSLAVTSLRGAYRTILTTQGIRGFWAGASTGLLQAVPNSVLYMTVYEQLKRRFGPDGTAAAGPGLGLGTGLTSGPGLGLSPSVAAGVAGALARFNAVTLIAPLELVKTLQAAGRQESISSLILEVIRREGVSGLFRGWSSTILRDVPFSAVYWMSFERIKGLYRGVFGLDGLMGYEMQQHPQTQSSSSSQTPSSSQRPLLSSSHPCQDNTIFGFCSLSLARNPNLLTFLSGASAGVLAALITHPFDVLKTHTQLQHINTPLHTPLSTPINTPLDLAMNKSTSHSTATTTTTTTTTTSPATIKPSLRPSSPSLSSSPISSSSHSGIFTALRHTYATQGVVGLYRGLSMRLLTVIPASAIMVTVYEFIKNMEM